MFLFMSNSRSKYWPAHSASWVLCTFLLVAAFNARPAHSQASDYGPDAHGGLTWGTISYFAGGGTAPFANGVAASQLQSIQSYTSAVDSQGNLYLQVGGQAGSNSIYMIYNGGAKIPPILSAVTSSPQAGSVYLVAGGTDIPCNGVAPNLCSDASTALQATFGFIAGMSFDANDNLYLADEDAGAIRRIDYTTTAVTSVAGQLNNPTLSGSTDVGDGGPATAATLFYESDVKVDTAGNLYIADGNNEVRVVYQGSTVPAILTAEGVTPQKGYIYSVAGSAGQYCPGAGSCNFNGPAKNATFGYVIGVTVDSSGNLYVADSSGAIIVLIYAGVSEPPLLKTAGVAAQAGDLVVIGGQQFSPCATAPCGDGGTALEAQFNSPYHLQVDSTGNLYLQDQSDYTVRKIDSSGYVSVSAGTESPGSPASTSTGNGGPATNAQFQAVNDFVIDASNALYVLDAAVVWHATAAELQTISFPALDTVAYGVAPITLDAVAEDAQGNPTNLPITYTATGPGKISGSNLYVTGVGTIQVVATQAGNAQYSPATASQTLTVDKASLTVSANNASKTVGSPNPAFTASYAGFVNGDTIATALTGSPQFSTTATASSHAGIYPIDVSQGTLAAANYTFTFVPGVLTVSGSTQQTITFPSLSALIYGQSSTIALNATASSGLSVQYLVLSGPATVSGSTLTVTGGGSIVVAANQPGNDTYAAAAQVSQTLTVHPAALTVIGPTFSLVYGTPIDPSTFPAPTITGFVGHDTQALVTGSPLYTTTATGTPAAGQSFPVQVALGTLALVPAAANNYAFTTFSPGMLTIAGAAQTIVFDTLVNSTYGSMQQVHAVSIDAHGNPTGLPVTLTVTAPGTFPDTHSSSVILTTAIPISQLGSTAAGTATITATQAGATDYAAAQPVSQIVAFAKAPLNVTTLSATRESNAPNPTFTYQLGCASGNGASGCFVNNDSDIPSVVTGAPILDTTATQSSPPGNYPITISQGTLAAPNYTFNLIPGTLTVLGAGSFTISANPSNITIPAGQNRQITLTITPVNLYQGTITLSCGQLPANVSCIFSPSTFTFTGSNTVAGSANAAMGTLTVNTLGGTTIVGSLSHSSSSVTAGIALAALAFLGFTTIRFRRRALARNWMLLVAGITFFVSGLSSCGGSKSNSLTASPGSFSVSISGTGTTTVTDGSTVSQSTSLQITVQ